MIFQSKIKRSFALTFLIGVMGFGVTCLILYGISSFFVPDVGSRIGFSIGILIAYNILGLVLGLNGAIFSWLIFWLWGRKQSAELFLAEFRQNGFKAPSGEIEDSAESYLEWVKCHEELPVDVRLQAAKMVGFLEGNRAVGMMHMFQMTMALEDALQQLKTANAADGGN